MNMNKIQNGLLVVALVALVALVGTTNASANLQFSQAGIDLTGPDGAFVRQAGAHPDLNVNVAVPVINTPNDGVNNSGPAEALHTVDVDLPAGMVGNPTSFATCTPADLANDLHGAPLCSLASQIGVVHLTTTQGPINTAIYNIAHGPDVPAKFGFNYLNTIAIITARVRPGDYGISSGSFGISQTVGIESVKLTFWGVPTDSSHDLERQAPGVGQIDTVHRQTDPNPPASFITTQTSCSDTSSAFAVRGDSWDNEGAFDTRKLTTDEDGTPFVFDGCERLPFRPTINVQPLSHTADAPTGLDVAVTVAQSSDPYGLATAHVRRVTTVLPNGMSVSPSSAAGLGACAPDQINLGTVDAPTCPASSRIGTVTIDTPLLDTPLSGDVILAKQNDNPFKSLLALYLAVKGPGFYLKLPGKVDLDPATGQLTATFDNTPQLPFSELHVTFQGGSQAPLATPTACGSYVTHAEITSWASSQVVSSNSTMTIDQGCDSPVFAPSFSAGMANPLAGQDSPFVFTLTRADRQPMLSSIDTVLPAGLLAQIGSVTQCAADAAAVGACPGASQIGTVTTLAGPGAEPLALRGQVYLTGPYKNLTTGQDAPFGLSIAVPTAGQAGPFDLGVVVVRAGIYVDRTDAHVTVKSDPLPVLIQGIPLRLRQVQLSIDRPHFMFNPTSCKPSSIFGIFSAVVGGTLSQQAVQFQAGGCGDLTVDPKLALTFTGKKSTTDGTHPGVDAKLTVPAGSANLQKAEVKLPLSVALDPDNAQALCTPAQRAALNCPKTSIVGTARAVSVLPDPLTGPVYFVEGTRKSASGRIISTLPKLWIPLSADGVTIDVNADSAVDSLKRLVTTFHDIPDAPIKEFDLHVNGGNHGIIVVSGRPGTCDRDKTIDSRFTGQNAQTTVVTSTVKVDGCKASVRSTRLSSTTVTVRVGNIGSGKLSLSAGGLVQRATRTIKRATEASITAKLTSKGRSSLRHHKKVRLALRVSFRPKSGRVVVIKKTLLATR